MKQRMFDHNKSTSIPRAHVFVDCESSPRKTGVPQIERHPLRLGAATYVRLETVEWGSQPTRRRQLGFTQPSQFWAWLQARSRKREVTWIWAHNLAFDATLLGLWPRIASGELKITTPGSNRQDAPYGSHWTGLLLLKDPPTVIGIEAQTGHRWLLVDSLNYFRCPLKQLGELHNCPKLAMPEHSDPDWIWQQYCERDVEILERSVLDLLTWWAQKDYGMFRWTAPGLSFAAWRHSFMPHKVAYHDNDQLRKFERSAYYGGEIRLWRLGEVRQHLTVLDVNSLYPSVMLDQQYPVWVDAYDLDASLTYKKPPIDPAQAICEVELDSPIETFPVRTTRGVYYARGEGLTVLAGPELQYAFSSGLIRRWGSWVRYVCRPIFRDFVQHFWELRQHYKQGGNRPWEQLVKQLLVSLHGKFGQLGGGWEQVEDVCPLVEFGQWSDYCATSNQFSQYLTLGNVTLKLGPSRELPKSSPAISAFCTAYGRQRMRQLRQLAGNRDVLYQNTDSLIVTGAGRAHLWGAGEIDPQALGKLKIESEADSAEFRGLNDYTFGGRLVQSGRKGAATDLAGGCFRQVEFDGLSSTIQRGPVSDVLVKTVIRTRPAQFTKGAVLPDGQVEPLFIQLLPE